MSSALVDLVLPAGCAGCQADGQGLCASCLRSFGKPFAHTPDPPPAGLPPVWVAGRYDGPIRAAILAYKERGRRDLAPALGGALARAVLHIPWVHVPSRLLLVPVPSRPALARLRGGDHVRRLAVHAAAQLRAAGIATSVASLLRVATRPRDAAGLTADDRAENVRGAFAPRRQISAEKDAAVVVVDDLITTGSTLAEAVNALRSAALSVAAGAAIAATQRLGSPVARPSSTDLLSGRGGPGGWHTGCAGANAGPDGAVRNAPAQLASIGTQGKEAPRQHRPAGQGDVHRRETTAPTTAATPPGTGWRQPIIAREVAWTYS
jgi:predicted amidophosphoribosyltransferase